MKVVDHPKNKKTSEQILQELTEFLENNSVNDIAIVLVTDKNITMIENFATFPGLYFHLHYMADKVMNVSRGKEEWQ